MIYEEFSLVVKHKRLLKSIKTINLVQIYFEKFNKLAVITNFLAFFQFLFENFSLLDPDPGGKRNADPDPCGSCSTTLPTG